eukprot:1867397-Amphidinium_carterae.1
MDEGSQKKSELRELKDILRTMQKQLSSIPDIARTLASRQSRLDSLEKRLIAMEKKQPPPSLAPTVVTDIGSQGTCEFLLGIDPTVMDKWETKNETMKKGTIFLCFATTKHRWSYHVIASPQLRQKYPRAWSKLVCVPAQLVSCWGETS